MARASEHVLCYLSGFVQRFLIVILINTLSLLLIGLLSLANSRNTLNNNSNGHQNIQL